VKTAGDFPFVQNDPVRKKTDKIEELPNYYHILLPNHYNYQCGKMQHFPTHGSTRKQKQPRGSGDSGSTGLFSCYAAFRPAAGAAK
jgi:hypothetical protein